MRLLVVPLLLLCSSALCLASPPQIDIPPESKLQPTQAYLVIIPKTDAVSILYISLDDAKAFPSEFLKDAKNFVLPAAGLKAGTYRFIAVGASATGEQSRADFTVTIEGPPDPFLTDLATAYAKEPAADKSKSVAALASLYRTAAKVTVKDESVKTVADLFADMKAASVTLLPADAIPAVRKVVGERLNKSIGKDGSAEIDRSAAEKELLAVATALEGLK